MRCNYFRCTMRSDLCLEFQARARGKSRKIYSWTNRDSMLQQWEIKYKPCLDCAQGKEIAANGGKDDDVEDLKTKVIGNEQTKFCNRCEHDLPKSAFGPHSGNKDGLQCYCRQCQRNIQNECSARKRAEKAHVNTPAPPSAPAEIPPGGKSDIEEKPTLRTCERCGFAGEEKHFHMAGNNGYIDVCRQCIVKQRKANEQFKKDHTVTLGPQDIVLNFADFPDLLETLTAEARKNFRTLANEILYRVANHVK